MVDRVPPCRCCGFVFKCYTNVWDRNKKMAAHVERLSQLGIEAPETACNRCLFVLTTIAEKTGATGDAALVLFAVHKLRTRKKAERSVASSERKRREVGTPTKAEWAATRRKPIEERAWVKSGMTRNAYYYKLRCEKDPGYAEKHLEEKRAHCRNFHRKKSASRPENLVCKRCGVNKIPQPRHGVGSRVCRPCKIARARDLRREAYAAARVDSITRVMARQRVNRAKGLCNCGGALAPDRKQCQRCIDCAKRSRDKRREGRPQCGITNSMFIVPTPVAAS